MQITEKVSPMHPDKVADRIAGACLGGFEKLAEWGLR